MVAAVAVPVRFYGFYGSSGAGVYTYAACAAEAFFLVKLDCVVAFVCADGFYGAKCDACAAAEAFVAVDFDEFGDGYVDASFAEGFDYFCFHVVGNFGEDFSALIVDVG
jgi:hypothetical protein